MAAAAEQPTERIARLKEELQAAETELDEATSMRSEAQGLGEDDVIAELAMVEERLQAEILELKAELLHAQSEASAAASAALRVRMAKLRQSALSRSRNARPSSELPSDLAAQPSGTSLASQPSSSSVDAEAASAALTGRASDIGERRMPAARSESGRGSSPRRSTFSVANITAAEAAVQSDGQQSKPAEQVSQQSPAGQAAQPQGPPQPGSRGLEGKTLQQLAAEAMHQHAVPATDTRQGLKASEAPSPATSPSKQRHGAAQQRVGSGDLQSSPPAMAALSAKLPTDAFNAESDAWKGTPQPAGKPAGPDQVSRTSVSVNAFPPAQHAAGSRSQAAEQLPESTGVASTAAQQQQEQEQQDSDDRVPEIEGQQPASDAWSSFGNGPGHSTVPSLPTDETFSPTKAGFPEPTPSQQQPEAREAVPEEPDPADSALPNVPSAIAAVPVTSYTEAVINSAAAAAKGVAVALGISDAGADSIDSTADTVRQAFDPAPAKAADSDTAPGLSTQAPSQQVAPQPDSDARSSLHREPAPVSAPPASSSNELGRTASAEAEQPAVAQASVDLPPVATQAVSAADSASPKSAPSRSSSPAAGGRSSPSKYRHASSKALPVGRSKPGTPATSQPGSPAQSQSQKPASPPILQAPVSPPASPFSLQARGSGGSPAKRFSSPTKQPAAEDAAPAVDTHTAVTAEADAMEAGLPLTQQQQQQQDDERGVSQGSAGDDAWSSLDTEPPAQAKPTSQFSLLTPQPPSLLPSAPEPEEWQQSEATAADAIQHAWSGNPFMDFKLSGGLASTQSAHSQEPDPFSSGFAPQREASAAAAQPQAPASADAWNAPMATSASHEHSFGFGDEPPAHDSAVTQQPKYGAESSHGFGAQPAHDAATDTGCFPQPGKHADEWADAMWGDTLPSHAPPQGSSPAAAAPPPPPSQQAESPGKEQAGKPAFATADAWADFGGGKSMLSLDRGAFGAPKQASGSLLSVSLPSKQSQGGAWGFEDLQPAASGRSWDDSPAGSREASPQRSLPSRHSQRAEDNPFEADFDLAPQSQPETSQPSATSSSQSKLGKRLASIKQMNTSMNKSAKQMLKSDNVRKLQDAMKVKWRGRTTTEEDPTPDASAPESEVTSRGISDVSGAWTSEGPRTSISSFEPQDSLSKALGIELPRPPQPAPTNQWSDRPGPSRGQQADNSVLGWRPMGSGVKQKCQAAFKAQGLDTENAGMQSDEAMVLFMRINPSPACGFRTLFTWCDLDGDGKLNEQEFCLYMYMLKAPEHATSLPLKLTPTQVAHVLDEPAPATGRDAASDASAASEAPSHLSPWLQPFRTGPTADDLPAGQDQSADQSASALSPELLTLTGKGYQEDDCKRALFLHANDVKPALEWLQERFGRLHSSEPSSDLTSSLSIATRGPDIQSSAPKGFEFRADPASPPGSRGPRLQILVERADVPHYKKALDGPFFALALRDANGALLESELATPPGHLDREAGCIAAGHAVTFRTPIMDIPEGAALFFEVRHYKMQERRLSTLAWSFIPVEVFILHHHQSSGSPMSPRLSGPKVRTGPMFLSLYNKPTDEHIHARSHLHHAAAIARRGPKPIGKVHDLFISVLVA